MQKLTIGRIVHYNVGREEGLDEDPTWAPAICTWIGSDRRRNEADLYVFPRRNQKGYVVTVDVRDFDDGHGANDDTWRWPPRS